MYFKNWNLNGKAKKKADNVLLWTFTCAPFFFALVFINPDNIRCFLLAVHNTWKVHYSCYSEQPALNCHFLNASSSHTEFSFEIWHMFILDDLPFETWQIFSHDISVYLLILSLLRSCLCLSYTLNKVASITVFDAWSCPLVCCTFYCRFWYGRLLVAPYVTCRPSL